MRQFENLRLRNLKGLKEASLCDLAKINVFCGPNSSGKSTALECVEDPKHRARGRKFPDEIVREIEVESFKGLSWQYAVGAKYFSEALDVVFSSRDVFFEDDGQALWKLVGESFSKQRGSQVNLGFGQQFMDAFVSKFGVSPSVRMIPAKRRLDSAIQLNTDQPIDPTGSGILNYLFRAKNKEPSALLRQCFEKIASGFTKISGGYQFETLLRDKNEIELRFRAPSGNWLFADDCGLGFRDLLIVLYFSIAADDDVILVEEPESHLHPEIQRELITFLRSNSDKQFFLSTHSSMFLNAQFADRIFSCRMTDEVKIENATSRAALLTDLGYSIADNIVSDVVVLCEGPKDKPVLEEFFRKLGLSEKFRIKIWPLGGDIMDQLDLSVFREDRRIVALIDNDPHSGKVRKSFLKKCGEQGIPCHQLQRYALENYFTTSAIQQGMKVTLPTGISAILPNSKVVDQLGFEVKRNGKEIAEKMSLQDIAGTDLEVFLHMVRDHLRSA